MPLYYLLQDLNSIPNGVFLSNGCFSEGGLLRFRVSRRLLLGGSWCFLVPPVRPPDLSMQVFPVDQGGAKARVKFLTMKPGFGTPSFLTWEASWKLDSESVVAAALDRAVRGRGRRSRWARLDHAHGHCLAPTLQMSGLWGLPGQDRVAGRVLTPTSPPPTVQMGTCAKPIAVCETFARLFSADWALNYGGDWE